MVSATSAWDSRADRDRGPPGVRLGLLGGCRAVWVSLRRGAAHGAGGGGEQAGRAEPFAPGDGLGIVGVVAGHDLPAGTGEQPGGLAGFEGGPGRLAQGGDRGLEAGSGLAAGAGGRHADGQAAAGPRDLAELVQDAFQDGRLQVDRHPFQQEQAGLARVEPGGGEPVRDRVAGEVGLDEPHLAGGDAEPRQPVSLVALGRGMVDLEPADAGLGVPQGPAVVAGRADHDLADAPADGADHHPVEEPGAGVEVVAHPARGGLLACRDVRGQRLVGGGIAVGGRDPGESEAVRGHAPGRDRRAAAS